VIKFFLPYLGFLNGAAYNVQQTLEGFGLTSSNFIERDTTGKIIGSYWSASEAIVVSFGALIIYSFVLFISLLMSGFVLGKWKGSLISFFIISIPGIFSVVGFWPQINYMPDTYVIDGTGELGSVKGFIPLLALGLVSGWSLIVNVYDTFKLNDKFRNYFDHFWYCSAVLAGIFFVFDSEANRNLQDLQEENRVNRQASLYFLDQVKNYDSYCREHNIEQKVSCKWTSDVQQVLNQYATYDEKVFYKLGPKTSKDIYSPLWEKASDQDVLEIRQEIKHYNDTKCPVRNIGHNVTQNSRPSGECQEVPAVFCHSFLEPPKGLVDEYIILHTVALASECIVPGLVASRERQEKLSLKTKSNSLDKHKRWLFFVLFSIVAGGKVANSSTKAIEVDKRAENDRRRIIKLIIKILNSAKKLFVWLLITVRQIKVIRWIRR